MDEANDKQGSPSSGDLRRRLGRSDIMCTPVGLGCAPLGELFVRVDDATVTATLEAAWSEGIRYFDTAPEYGLGLSEHRVGDFLAVNRGVSSCCQLRLAACFTRRATSPNTRRRSGPAVSISTTVSITGTM